MARASRRIRLAAAGAVMAGFAVANLPATAGVAGRPWKSSVVRICFVGDALTSKPKDVEFVLRHLKMFEVHGNLSFQLMGDGRCPPPRPSGNGRFDFHDGDLRIGIPGTSDYDGTPITNGRLTRGLGRGCPGGKDLATSWWSGGPDSAHDPKAGMCRLTTWVQKEMPLNAILHELGHAIGLYHEHERTDVPMNDPQVASCFRIVEQFGRGMKPGDEGVFHVTPYDRDSIMHYDLKDPKKPGCELGNDKGSTGFSTFDKLTIRIMYPREPRIAEVRGSRTQVFASSRPVVLKNEWGALGALVENVVRNPRWVVTRGNARITEQRKADFAFTFKSPGAYDVRYTFDGPLGRGYSNSFKLELVSPGALIGAALGPLL